nr:hybrid sensor histidine kinase/response regulator [Trichothermofontia sichuanensis]
MRIEDDELREVFAIASEEHIQNLDAGLLHLEKHPDDLETLKALMRDTHSLKGDANMLGLKDLGTLAHQMEHLLGKVTRGEQPFTPELADHLGHGLEAVRKLVHEALTGEPAAVNTFYVLAELMGATPAAGKAVPANPEADAEADAMAPQADAVLTPTVAPAAPPATADADSPTPPEPQTVPPVEGRAAASTAPVSGEAIAAASPPEADRADASPGPEAEGPNSSQGAAVATTNPADGSYRIETIRVPTRNLDALMTQAGELTVTKIRIAHRLAEVDAIVNLWEEWSRDLFLNRFLLEEIRKGTSNLQKLEEFHNRTEAHLEQLGTLVNQIRRTLSEDTARLELISEDLEAEIRTLRLLPLSTLFNLFPRLVRDLARQEGKAIELVIEGGDTRADKRILEEMKDPLMHILRNAVDHGIESPAERERRGKPAMGTIHLRGYQTPTHIVIEVSDDGRGLDLEQIKQTALKRRMVTEEELSSLSPSQIQNLIFEPGFSTRSLVTEVSGRGVGLDVVRTHVDRLKGNIQVLSTPGQGCTIRLQLSMTLATAHVLIVAVRGESYAIPVEAVETACLVHLESVFTIENRPTILHQDQPISVAPLAELLELPNHDDGRHRNLASVEKLPCIILRVGEERLGILVDALLDEQDVVLKPQSQLLKRVRNISGATILGTGRVCMVLNPGDLIKSVRRLGRAASRPMTTAQPTEQRRRSILLVEDSIATRTQEKRILEGAGYEVVAAVDGIDGFNKLQTRPFDAVVSDIQMPNLDGLGLTQRIRQHKEYSELPIILVTTLASEEDKRRGAEAGANAYITKSSFNQDVLLETLKRLI